MLLQLYGEMNIIIKHLNVWLLFLFYFIVTMCAVFTLNKAVN